MSDLLVTQLKITSLARYISAVLFVFMAQSQPAGVPLWRLLLVLVDVDLTPAVIAVVTLVAQIHGASSLNAGVLRHGPRQHRLWRMIFINLIDILCLFRRLLTV